jgi:nucleotide-binding universal stress UspA family protein
VAHTFFEQDLPVAQMAAIGEAEREMEVVAQRLHSDGVDVERSVPYGEAGLAIVETAERAGVDLIVMSTHGRGGVGRWLYGSVADSVLRHATVPVLVVPPTASGFLSGAEPLHLLVPLDGSEHGEAVLASTEMLATALKARMTLLRVVEPFYYGAALAGGAPMAIPMDLDALIESSQESAQSYVTRAADELRKRGLAVETRVEIGTPAQTIVSVASETGAHLIAMATHGRGGVARLVLGSVATRVLQRSDVPVLLVRPAALARDVPAPAPSRQVDAPVLPATPGRTP